MLNWTAIFFVILVSAYFAALAYFEKEYSKKAFISNDEYLTSLAIVRQCSVYDLFQSSGVDWRFSNSKIETDFKAYLNTGHIPQYVVDYVRQNIRPEDVTSLRLTSGLWRA
jgi:hypothetical protein